MAEILRTTNPVLISFVSSLLAEAGLAFHVADTNMSIVEGSISVFPRRVLVRTEDAGAARSLLIDAGLGNELVP
jgi:hypothetical protein